MSVILGIDKSTQERWLPVPGSDKHFVSAAGKIIKRVNASHPERRQTVFIVPGLNKNGYEYIKVFQKRWLVHRLVYAAFVGPLKPGLVVCHLDGSRTGNDYTNLRQTTQAENMSHKITHGTHQEGEKHGRAIYTDKTVRNVKNAVGAARRSHSGRLGRFEGTRIALEWGVSIYLVYDINNHNRWSHL